MKSLWRALVRPMQVGVDRYWKPWWILVAGFSLHGAIAASTWSGSGYCAALTIVMLWPLRQPARFLTVTITGDTTELQAGLRAASAAAKRLGWPS